MRDVNLANGAERNVCLLWFAAKLRFASLEVNTGYFTTYFAEYFREVRGLCVYLACLYICTRHQRVCT